MWINQNFLLQEDIVVEGNLNITFVSLRGSGPVNLRMETGGQVRLNTAYLYNVLVTTGGN